MSRMHENMSVVEKLSFLRKMAVSVNEISQYFGWCPAKTYRVINKIKKTEVVNLVARFEPQKVNLENFLIALETSREEQIELMIKTNPNNAFVQSEKIKTEEFSR